MGNECTTSMPENVASTDCNMSEKPIERSLSAKLKRKMRSNSLSNTNTNTNTSGSRNINASTNDHKNTKTNANTTINTTMNDENETAIATTITPVPTNRNTNRNTNANTNTKKTKNKCEISMNKYDLYEKKVLSSKGQLESPCGLEWFPKGHGHKRVKKLFDLKDELGHGVTGIVFSAVYKGKKCAIKRIQKNTDWSVALVTSEGRILRNLKDIGIINLIDMYFDNDYYYFIMEKAHYDLFSWIQVTDWAPEDHCSKIVRNLFKSLKYLHDKNVVHRDLKPENIVFCKDDKFQPKFVDFGDALFIKNDKTYNEFVGTPQYMGKERFVDHKGWQLKKSDVFALGVISFEMLARERCFCGETQQEIFDQVSNGKWEWPDDIQVSRECHDFIKWCLQPEAENRPSCEDALSHPWLTGQKLLKNDSDNNNTNWINKVRKHSTDSQTSQVSQTSTQSGLRLDIMSHSNQSNNSNSTIISYQSNATVNTNLSIISDSGWSTDNNNNKKKIDIDNNNDSSNNDNNSNGNNSNWRLSDMMIDTPPKGKSPIGYNDRQYDNSNNSNTNTGSSDENYDSGFVTVSQSLDHDM